MDNQVPTQSELLNSFLEGELDSSLESSLFSSLNSSPELRAEMRDMLALSREVRRDRVALVPPIASTAAVFGALGMSTSMLVSSGWLSTLWSKLWMPLAAGLISSAATWYFVAPASSDSSSNMTLTTTEQSASNAVNKSNTQADLSQAATVIHDTVIITKTKEVPLYVSEQPSSTPQTKEVLREVTKEVIRTVYVPVIDEPFNKDEIAALRSSHSSSTSVEQSDNQNGSPRDRALTSQTSLHSGNSFKPTEIIENESTSQLGMAPLLIRKSPALGWTPSPEAVNTSQTIAPMAMSPEAFRRQSILSMRGLNGLASNVSVSVAADNSIGFNNMALGFHYLFTEYFGAGIEVGAEPFAMKFQGVKDGVLQRYEANPSLLWGAAQVKILPFPSLLESGWQPYVQINGGGTSYGLLAKVLVGSYYSPTPHLRIMAGFERSDLFYTVQSSTFSTAKYGFTYGIGYQF